MARSKYDPELVDVGVRTRARHGGENYYFFTSERAMCVTVPRENDPNMSDEREHMELLCRAFTEARGGEPV